MLKVPRPVPPEGSDRAGNRKSLTSASDPKDTNIESRQQRPIASARAAHSCNERGYLTPLELAGVRHLCCRSVGREMAPRLDGAS